MIPSRRGARPHFNQLFGTQCFFQEIQDQVGITPQLIGGVIQVQPVNCHD